MLKINEFVPEIRVGYVDADSLIDPDLPEWKRESVASPGAVMGLAFMANPPGPQWVCIGMHVSSDAVWCKDHDIGSWLEYENATWLAELDIVGARKAKWTAHQHIVWCEDVTSKESGPDLVTQCAYEPCSEPMNLYAVVGFGPFFCSIEHAMRCGADDDG